MKLWNHNVIFVLLPFLPRYPLTIALNIQNPNFTEKNIHKCQIYRSLYLSVNWIVAKRLKDHSLKVFSTCICLCLFVGQFISPRLESRIALCGCTLNVFVFAIVSVYVFVFLLVMSYLWSDVASVLAPGSLFSDVICLIVSGARANKGTDIVLCQCGSSRGSQRKN